MMKDTRAAYRYARSFFLLMGKKDRLREVHEELARLGEFVKTHREFSRLLVTTTIPYQEKESVVDHLLGESPAIANLVKLLVRKKRFGLMEKVIGVFHDLYNTDRGIEEATLVTALPLHKETVERVRTVLEKKLGKKVTLAAETDPDILGGAVLYTRHQIIDGSLRQRFLGLKQALLRAKG